MYLMLLKIILKKASFSLGTPPFLSISAPTKHPTFGHHDALQGLAQCHRGDVAQFLWRHQDFTEAPTTAEGLQEEGLLWRCNLPKKYRKKLKKLMNMS